MREKKNKGGGGKKRANHLMDVAVQAYARYLALQQWRFIMDAMETRGETMDEALASCGNFTERAPYHTLWQRLWQGVRDKGLSGEEVDFGDMEKVAWEAVPAEEAQRKADGDVTIEDTHDYQIFIQAQMNNLLGEASGDIEEID